jgi:hypothetical protein
VVRPAAAGPVKKGSPPTRRRVTGLLLLVSAGLPAAAKGAVVAQDTVLIAPAPRYAPRGPLGWLTRLVFGGRYRDLWSSPVPMPLLAAADTGDTRVFRPLDRRLDTLVPEASRRLVVTGPLQDLMSGRHPGAALVAPPLARAAGVDVPSARLAARPGANGPVAGLVTRRLPERESITSDELLDRLVSTDDAVDAEAWLRERLLDVYLNHWDFRPGDWRWTREVGGRWTPLPRDRDGAFARYDGLVGVVGARFAGELSSFGTRYARRLAVTGATRALDARLLAGVSPARWDVLAREISAAITDSAIAASVAALPDVWARDRATLERALRARRDGLPAAAARFRDMVRGGSAAAATEGETPPHRTTRVLPWFALGGDPGLRLGPEIVHTVVAGDGALRARYRLHAGYATAPAAFAAGGRAEWWPAGSTTRVAVEGRVSSVDVLRFYGFGNETAREEDDTHYRADQRVVAAGSSVEWAVSPDARLSAGLVVKHVTTRDRGERLMQIVQPYGWDGFGQAGLTVAATVRGPLALAGGATFHPPVLDAEEAFGRVWARGSAALSPPGFAPLTVAVRIAGERAWGRYPVHEAVQLGGAQSVRSLRSRRFTGDAAAWANLDLRLRVAELPFVMPWDFGVLGIADLGRVWVKGEESRRWHHGLGGGLWAALPDRSFLVVADVVRGDDGTAVWLGTRFAF